MSEMKLPLCPICKREILLPLSIYVTPGAWEKVFGNWICTNCGFSITTAKKSGAHTDNIITDFNMALRTRIEDLRKEYKK